MATFRALSEADKKAALKEGSSIPAVGSFDAAAGNVLEQAILEVSVPAANQAASVAADVATLVTDFNALLTKLKAVGLMVADA